MKAITDDVLRVIYASFCETIADILNSGQDLAPQLIALDSHGEYLGPLMPPQVLAASYTDQPSKRALFAYLRLLGIGVAPAPNPRTACVVQVVECWVKHAEDAQVAVDLLRAGVPVRHLPGRVDAVMLTLHTSEGLSINVLTFTGTGLHRAVVAGPMSPRAFEGTGDLRGMFAPSAGRLAP